MHSYRNFFLIMICIALASCGKSESPGAVKPSIDTNQKAEPVQITDTNHHLYFRPKVGSVQHYYIIDRRSMSSADSMPDGKGAEHTATSTTEFYIHQTVKSVRPDSSVELSYRVDSVVMASQADTTKINYSSNNVKDKANENFREFNIMIGKDFSIRVNKFGDPDSVTDVSSFVSALMAPLPDSLKNDPKVRKMATQQAEQVADAYVVRVLVHNPTRALVKDTTWRNASDVNLDIAQGLSFPVHVDATETVRGLEKRGDILVAVLEDNTKTTLKNRILQEGPATATINDFVANSHSVVHIEDATGLLMHRTVQEKRNFTIVVESKEHPGDKRTITQNGSEEMTMELVE
jgi:hypothetical protein